MDPAAFDLRLVEALLSKGLMKEEGKGYLKIVRQRAEEANDEGVMERADHVLRLLL